ncbi:enoyl-CoA hydratase/isomerase family protein [Paraburkholderia sp. BR14374]|uniref:enoyl-CoA hydratase/isomerase family protein n=1 Tax=Paraburkholderia sp. BR14374 TaxID=3237007 RepID=UPI0034CE0BAD
MNAVINEAPATIEQSILFRVVNRVGIITLNRPKALNSLTHGMILEIERLLELAANNEEILAIVFEGAGVKGFCAGGDVRTLYVDAKEGRRDGPQGWAQFFVDEYRIDYAIHRFVKPVVALMDGITMGGGMGLAQGCDLRVATTRTKIAMPETRIGLLTDVGATKFLSSMRADFELYVGLTGVHLNGVDAVFCGLADVCVEPAAFEDYEERLQLAQWGEASDVLEVLHNVFATKAVRGDRSVVESFAHLIGRHFHSSLSISEIQASIEGDLKLTHTEGDRAWLEAALEALTHCSPLMLAVTREALLRGRNQTLEECFRMELDAVYRAIDEGDFCEGVRALLVDKDKNPTWKLHGHEEVRPEHVKHSLSSPWSVDQHPLRDLGT